MNAMLPITRDHRLPERFLSDSGRTAGSIDRAGMQQLAEEHEWLRDRVAALEIDNARLRSVIEANARLVLCQDSGAA